MTTELSLWRPAIEGASVEAKVLQQGDKVIVFKRKEEKDTKENGQTVSYSNCSEGITGVGCKESSSKALALLN
jgi:ribosomal protein L21